MKGDGSRSEAAPAGKETRLDHDHARPMLVEESGRLGADDGDGREAAVVGVAIKTSDRLVSAEAEAKSVSLDYPDYLRIRERSRLLGWLWMIGDRGYYLGLVGAAFTLSSAFAIVLTAGVGRLVGPGDERALTYWPLLPLCGIAFPIFLGVWWGAGYLKGVAHRRSGIHDRQAKGE